MLLITLTSCKKQVWSLAMLLLVSVGGRRIPAQIQKSRFDSDVWLQNVLTVKYIKCSNHKEAIWKVSWWCLLAWMLNAGPFRDLFQVFYQHMQREDMHKNDSMDRTRNRSSATNQRCVNVQRLTSTAGQTPIDVFKNCGFVPTATVQPCSKDPVFFNQFKDKTCVVCCLLWVFWNWH